MSAPRASRAGLWTRRVLWVAAIWAASVLALGVVALLLRVLMGAAGLRAH